ncbi:LysR family transcriptional regulator [Salinispirillum sp. LH 10-3-1]|uniref:LysR family transcriptional regulator n=1 Tax=Salinispirillum sp. LH 10-3-1 TaxID=2952525 RepID=UPI00351AC0E1
MFGIRPVNIARHDLNLLVYLDVLLREKNVTRAADRLNISQPAMSNGLKRLREMFHDPLLVRTSRGMEPTVRALALQPVIHQLLMELEATLQSDEEFNAETEPRVFRIMASDYAATTLLPELMRSIRDKAPNLVLDIMTPSDVDFRDVEEGKIDMAINMFEDLPLSFYQKNLWHDDFRCLVHHQHPCVENFTLETYLAADHVWVSKTGYGVGTGISSADMQKLGWVDRKLEQMGHTRKIKLFTRDYHVAMYLALFRDLIVTVPARAAQIYAPLPQLAIFKPPFDIPPIELKMVWSPLLHHDRSHIWLRQQVADAAEKIQAKIDRGLAREQQDTP